MLPPKAYGALTVTYHEGGGGAWSGRITYSKTRESDETETGLNAGGYATQARSAESYSRTATLRMGSSELMVNTGLEQILTLIGDATVIVREEQLNENQP